MAFSMYCRRELRSHVQAFYRGALQPVPLQDAISGTQLTCGQQSRAAIATDATLRRSYYDVLAISPKSSQSQIKKAYFELSKTYHPDQNPGQDAALKFIQITEAYEVIGNVKKRRMYDQGLLGKNLAATPDEAEEYSSKFYETRSKRSRAPTASGRTPIYDFDEWSKLHYESNFERRENAKQRYENILRRNRIEKEEKKSETVIYIIGVAVILFGLKFSFTPSEDIDRTKK